MPSPIKHPPPRRTVRHPRRSGAGGTLLGIFIGIVVGLGLAAGVAFWLIRNNPAVQPLASSKDAREAGRDGRGTATPSDKPRFDFYKILPGIEEPKVQRPATERGDRAVAEQSRERNADKSPPPAPPAAAPDNDKVAIADPAPKGPKAGDRYWLQAGSFTAQADAENLKARLALGGWEANVQEGTLPDKGVRYRVRLGPYENPDELARMKADLARRGFDVAVIKY